MLPPISKLFMRGKRWPRAYWALKTAVLLTLLVVVGTTARAQTNGVVNYEGEKVTAIDLASQPQADVDYLRALLLQQVGQPYSNMKVQQSIAAMMSTGEFSSVRVRATPDNGSLKLLFILEPAYYLGLVQFPGAVPPLSYTRLLQVVMFSEGSPFLKRQMNDATGAIKAFLTRSGYFAASVNARTEIDKEHKLVNPIFEVTLHRRAKIGSIDFEGLSGSEADEQRAALRSFWTHFKKGRLTNGTTFTQERIQAAIGRIRSTLGAHNRLAQEVSLKSANYDPNANRVNLLFHVTLGPEVTVQLQGAHIFKRTLKRLIPIYQENSYDSDLLAEGRKDLANYFQSKGYFDVQVAPQVQESPDRVDIVYRIQKGSKHKVENIAFMGNHGFNDAALRAAIVIRTEKFLFSRGRYSETLLRNSVSKIVNMYQVAGYPDVQVETRVQDLEPEVRVTFKITEGMQAVVHSFQIIGDGDLDTSKLPVHGFLLASGKPYSPEYELEDRNDILAYYLDRGFLSARLKSTATPVNGNKYQVDVTYRIQPGAATRVQDVVYLGNVKTQTSLVANTTSLSPEMPLSESKMLAAESDLYNLGIFDWTSVGPRRAQAVGSQLVDAPQPGAGIPEQSPADSAPSQNPAEAGDPPTPGDPAGPVQNESEEVLVKVHESQRNTIEYGGGLEIISRGGTAPGGAIVVPGLAPIPVGSNFQTSEQRFFGPRGSFAYTLRNLRGRGDTFTASILGSRLDNRATLSYGVPRFWSTNWSSLLSSTG